MGTWENNEGSFCGLVVGCECVRVVGAHEQWRSEVHSYGDERGGACGWLLLLRELHRPGLGRAVEHHPERRGGWWLLGPLQRVGGRRGTRTSATCATYSAPLLV